MSSPQPTPSFQTDRNLLFGVLALQADLLDAGRFAEGCTAWSACKDKALADLLVERGWLSAEDRHDVERLLQRKLNKHAGDPHASLAEALQPPTRELLGAIEDPEVQHSLAGLSDGGGQVLLSTTAYQPEKRERYTLTRVHAKGGIGQVWLARDDDLGREVALKEIRADRSSRAEIWSRFVEEARITGQLQHPGIVPVYELARRSEDQRPFYTMRFVQGRTLREASKEYHRKRQAGQAGPLDLRELLGQFVGVCNAIAYAHDRGVLHRDLKGSNVILGDFGEVIVLDWGLAKVRGKGEGKVPPVSVDQTTAHGETQAGQVIGTPGYLSPEQAAGRLDLVTERSDVYGLGAILYEILTGHPPFVGDDSHEVIRRAARESPAAPRGLVPETPRALEAVCLRALAKEPAERYASAGELATEIRHYLADEPVAAFRDPWPARSGRWARRHRTLVTGMAAAALVAVVSLAAATALLSAANRRESEARQLAQQRSEEAEREKAIAQTNFRLAREAVDEYCTKVGQDARLKEHDLTGLRQQLLGTAVSFYQRFIHEHGDDPELRAELGRAYSRLALMHNDLDQYDQATPLGRQAVEVFQGLLLTKPADPDLRHELARSHADLSLCYGNIPNVQAALDEEKQALAVWTDLVKEYPDEPRYARGLARASGGLGEMVRQQRRFPEAERLIQDAIDMLERLHRRTPDDEDVRSSLASNYRNLANTYRMSRKTRAGIEAAQHAEKLWVGLTQSNSKDPYYRKHVAITLHILALLYEDLQDLEHARAAFARAIAIHKELADTFPSVGSYQDDLAGIHVNFGLYLARTGHRVQAIEATSQAVELRRKLADRYPQGQFYQEAMAHTLSNLAALYGDVGREDDMALPLQQAVTYLQRSDCIVPSAVETHRYVANNLTSLVTSRLRKGTPEQAVEACRLLVTVREKVAARPRATTVDSYWLGAAYSQLASCLDHAKKPADSLPWVEKALATLNGVRPDTQALNQAVRQARLHAWQTQSQALRQLKRPAEAVAVWDRALQGSAPQEQPLLKLQRGAARANAGDHQAAVIDVQELAARDRLPGPILYDLACVFALCSAAARQDARLSEGERQKLSDRYGDRAWALLKQADAAHFFADPANVANAATDSDLDVLRQRPDFKKLQAGWGLPAKPSKK
jgi:serine/threonine-protein kinase